ncbi:hypothetical protein B4N89_46465 [Embleya scabrispora]|uniref:Uncharacterized protein n=1 Tax=Embleya scabrispora TaxID=159449 RepID=A0A1T3NIR7_9ACTN|nr:FG-GAP-like repeat-containing protein [Embleya scabrispora]OPC76481.1 hypothetical protein B4N89_46465 [Embleya scabrispora]
MNGGGKTADNTGTFYVTATDPDSGVGRVEYVLNGSLPIGQAPAANWDEEHKAWKVADVPVTRWGTNTLTVRAIDLAGNRTQPFAYQFYAPGNPNATTTLGDISGDTRVDMLAVTDGGALKMYDAGTDPTTGGRTVSNAGQGPMPGGTWTGAKLAHRGGAGVTRDDLFVYDGTNVLVYRNSDGYNGALPKPGSANNGGQFYVPQNNVLASRPFLCVDARTGQDCAPGIYADDWGRVKQIVAPGDVDGDGALDLITVEGDTNRLFLHSGNGTPGGFDLTAKLLGNTDWADRDIIAPGDVTGDERPDLWVRDRTTGNLYQYPSKVTTTGGIKVTDVSALGDDTRRVELAADLTPAVYPALHADGDLDGDKIADLWAEGPGGSLYVIRGNAPGSTTAFRDGQLLANSNTPWTNCKPFKSGVDPSKTFDICGPILDKYEASGGPDGELRLPVSGTNVDGDSIGHWADFQADSGNGTAAASLNSSPYTGTWIVRGTVRQKWLALGGPRGLLGYPVSDETKMYDGGGTYLGAISRFAGGLTSGPGAITATNAGTHEMHGDIYNRWQLLGGTRGFLGFPATDETRTPNKPGFYNHFLAPGAATVTGSIYASPTTGAWAVYGSIRNTWAAHGWENSDLGFPITDEFAIAGGRRSNFQQGYIHETWRSSTYTLYGSDRLVASADFDGDHVPDAVTIDDKGSLWLRHGNPDGTFRERVGMWGDTTWSGATAITAGDFDKDGKGDLIAATVAGKLWLYLGNGTGGLSDGKPLWSDGTWNPASGIAAGDFDGDGKLDIANIWANGELRLYRGDGKDKIATSIPFGVDASWGSISKITAGDFNADGKTDLAAIWANGALRLYTGNGNATINESINLGSDNSWATIRGIAAADINANGKSDITALWDNGTPHTYLDPVRPTN